MIRREEVRELQSSIQKNRLFIENRSGFARSASELLGMKSPLEPENASDRFSASKNGLPARDRAAIGLAGAKALRFSKT